MNLGTSVDFYRYFFFTILFLLILPGFVFYASALRNYIMTGEYTENFFPDHCVKNTASATISPQIHVFPSAAVGYGKQAAQTFTITNTGDVRLWHADSRGAISGWFNFELDDSCVYEINGFSFIDPGETCSFSVSPGQRLDLGVHHGSVTRWFIPAASFEEFSEIIGGSSDVHVSDMLGHPDLMEISTNFSFTVTEEF